MNAGCYGKLRVVSKHALSVKIENFDNGIFAWINITVSS